MLQENKSLNAELADLFDLDYGDFTDDLSLYEDLARRSHGPVLELGVGTGRVALHLARNGHAVWAIDNNDAMLARAGCKAKGLANLKLVAGDMRDFSIEQTFGLVLAGYGAFHHLLTPDDQLSCLRAVQRHLAPDGTLVFDLRAIFATDWEPGDSVPVLHDWTRTLADGSLVTKFRTIEVDRALQIQHETYYFDRVMPDGALRRRSTTVDLRFSTPYEIESLLHDAGFVVEQLCGDFDLSPYNSDSDLMITIARRATQ